MVKVNQRINTGIKELTRYLNQFYYGPSVSYWIKILGIILLTIGNFVLWTPLGVNDKIGLSLIFIAIFMLFFTPEKSIQKGNENKIFIFLTLWVLLMFFITGGSNIDTFFFFVVFGMLICMELAWVYLTPQLKKRLSFLILIFFSLCMVIVAEKVISFFHM